MISRRALISAGATLAVRPAFAGPPLPPGNLPPLPPGNLPPVPPGNLPPLPPGNLLPVPPGNLLAFRLIRHGDEIGRHTVTFEPQGTTLTVRIAVNALVTLLSIPIVRYSHQVVEVWQDGMLASLNGETNKNGTREWVTARRGTDGLEVLGSKTKRYIAPEPAGATSYWNKRLLDRPMISMEDGVLLRPKVVEEKTEPIPLATGAKIPAEHYNLSGAFAVDLWYDQTDTWASLGLTGADGSYVHYERL